MTVILAGVTLFRRPYQYGYLASAAIWQIANQSMLHTFFQAIGSCTVCNVIYI